MAREVWLSCEVSVVPGKNGLYHLAINAGAQGLVPEGST